MSALNKFKIMAYATLVKAGKYILGEEYREREDQILVPNEYIVAVSDEIVK